MIELICREEHFLYNLYHILKAFFPGDEISSKAEEKASTFVEILFDGTPRVTIEQEEIPLDMEDPYFKQELDRILYRKCREISGRDLAWGILTGVRPTKIAMKMLEEGSTKEEFLHLYTEELLVSPKKAALAWEIAGREKAVLQGLDYENGYSLYVGIPFCPTVCTYCSFSSGSLKQWAKHVDAYLDALCRELEAIADACSEKKLNTIYIGGGTPTTLDPEQLEKLLGFIDEHFSREYLLEYTVEAGRPDSITEEKLLVLKNHGITRISINPQTMQQKTLDKIGRKHTVQEIYDAFAIARRLGFDNINMDLIAGLTDETLSDMEDTLRQIESLQPDSLTVHSLAIKRAARMGQEKQKARMHAEMEAMITAAYQSAEKMGLKPYYLYRQKNIAGNYENVGYAKVDKAGIYNILIMEEKQTIIAAGAGASTKFVLKDPVAVPGNKKNKMTTLIRQENVKAIDAYIMRVDEMIQRKGEWLWR